MKLSNCTKLIGVSLLALGGLTGCPDEPEPRAPITHEAVQATLQDNIKGTLGRLDADLAFVETSELGEAAANLTTGVDCGELQMPGEPGEPADAMDCGPAELDLALTELADELAEIVGEVLTDEAIESNTNGTIIYRLSAEVLCDRGAEVGPTDVAAPPRGEEEGAPENEFAPEDDGEEPEADAGPDCEEMVTRLEPRVAVSEPTADVLRLRLMIGADRIAPLTVDVGPARISAEVNLSEAKRAVESIADTMEERLPPLPATFEGAIAVALDARVARAPSVSVSITQAINIVDAEGEFPLSLQAEAAAPAFQLTADAAAKQLSAFVGLGAINADVTIQPSVEVVGIATPDGEVIIEEHEEDPIHIALALAGVDLDAVFDIASETLTVETLGLGDGTTSLTINGENRVAVDLNPDDGRNIGFTVSSIDEAEGALVTLTKAVAELRVETEFAAPEGERGDWADWMEHEILSVRLEAADGANASVTAREEGLAVVTGQLSLDAEYADIHHVVEAGQCIAFPGGDDDPELVETEEEDIEEGPAPHPFGDLEVNACG